MHGSIEQRTGRARDSLTVAALTFEPAAKPYIAVVHPFEGTTVNTPAGLLAQLRAFNQTAAFNQWCGIEVVSAEPGKVEIAMPWRHEAGQYSGFLHAGLVGALIDTACGFAAASVVGRVLASHYAVNCLRPAVGERFAQVKRCFRLWQVMGQMQRQSLGKPWHRMQAKWTR